MALRGGGKEGINPKFMAACCDRLADGITWRLTIWRCWVWRKAGRSIAITPLRKQAASYVTSVGNPVCHPKDPINSQCRISVGLVSSARSAFCEQEQCLVSEVEQCVGFEQEMSCF